MARRVGPEIEIVVEDDGPGIPADKLEDIFKRFYSDRPQTDSTVGKNSGLGLSISREIVNAYGGRIWASNRMYRPNGATAWQDDQAELRDRRMPGVAGACFIVRLPAADAAPSKGAPLACPTPLSSCTAPAWRSGAPRPCCAGPPGPASPTSPCAFCSWPDADPAALEAPILVADDQVWLVRNDGRILAKSPDTIRGKMEVRGVGIVEVKSLMEAELALVVDLVPGARDRAIARGRRHGASCWASSVPLVAIVPVGSLGSHQAGNCPGTRETQLILYG